MLGVDDDRRSWKAKREDLRERERGVATTCIRTCQRIGKQEKELQNGAL